MNRSVRVQNIFMGKPVGSVIPHNWPPLTLHESFILDYKTHNPAFCLSRLYSQSIFQIRR